MTKNFTGKSVIDLPTDFCVIQLETTDLNPKEDDIIEIAVEKYRNNKIKDNFYWNVSQSNILAALLKLKKFIGNDLILINHGSFFCPFIGNAYRNNFDEAFSNNIIDIQRLFKNIENQDTSKLDYMIKFYHLSTPHEKIAKKDIASIVAIYFNLQKSFNEKFTNIKEIMPKNHFTLKDIQGDPSKNDRTNSFYGKHVSATGELNIYTRKELGQIINNIGGIFQLTPGNKTDYFIVGKLKKVTSSKLKKAKNLPNISFLTEEQFLEKIASYEWI
ncbi:BRCT domain-containing protein [Lactobacillus taiwanensis]|uniref:DNA polymerase III n=1 Tax=Lactobacillus taiwanensis TaxID=508451 RepID=A0A256LJZ5_9LACO|nr:BRCT domain-containing protein [Lactobacillus taiwanensis]OYR90315.1 DNA polymerase III [Lactobacillus taiwanensis]OYR92917.1 DNA polymerase III [Lactobacillus taiwanensis]OYR95848.1 DNA polymerase III [Lactobacillus taiwanensis]